MILLVRFQIVEMDSSDIFQDTGADGVEEYEEELTAAEVLQKLEDAWLNEKHSPELLEPKLEIVECMLEQVNTPETFPFFTSSHGPEHSSFQLISFKKMLKIIQH